MYKEFVKSKMKSGEAILETLTPEKANIIHMGMGVVGEAGELIDAIKKYTMYNKPIDLVNVIEELGDIEFYLEGLRQVLNLNREEIIAHNIAKLDIRYANGYSDKAAQERADKQVAAGFYTGTVSESSDSNCSGE